jgi:hypothetical protein
MRVEGVDAGCQALRCVRVDGVVAGCLCCVAGFRSRVSATDGILLHRSDRLSVAAGPGRRGWVTHNDDHLFDTLLAQRVIELRRHTAAFRVLNRGTSLIRNSLPPQEHHRTLGKVLLEGARRGALLLSEVSHA